MGIFIDKSCVDDILTRMNYIEHEVADFSTICWKEMYDDESNDDNLLEAMGLAHADYCCIGMSKICLFFEEYDDIVVKIPLMGCIHYDCHYDDNDEFVSEEESCNTYSHATVNGNKTWDYCAAEEYMYNLAVQSAVEEMFAETVRIGMTDSGYPIYVSRKVKKYNSSTITVGKYHECVKLIKDSNLRIGRLGKHVVAYMIASYSMDLVKRTIEFMRKNEIDNDMHSDNYRYDENGKIVFIDYSDFFDN